MKFTLFSFCLICVLTLSPPIISAKNYYVSVTVKATFLDAYCLCADLGKQLATVNSEEEQKELEATMSNSTLPNEELWLSGMDEGQEGRFVWMSTGKRFGYTNWGGHEPNNAGGNQNCVFIIDNHNDNRFKWGDVHCSRLLYFVCEDKK